MPRNVFVSYNFNDRHLAHNVRTFFQPGGGKVMGRPVFVEGNVSAQGSDAIDRKIRSTMEGCAIALFVVGDDVHNSPWINREADLATSKGLKLAAVRHQGSSGGLPNALKNRDIPIADWSEQSLVRVLNRL